MPDLPPITQEFRADTKHYALACRAIARHMTALADELDALDSPFGPLSPILPVPVDDPDALRPEPRRFEYPMGGFAPLSGYGATCCRHLGEPGHGTGCLCGLQPDAPTTDPDEVRDCGA